MSTEQSSGRLRMSSTLVSAVLLAASVAACGNLVTTDIIGGTGVSADKDGAPVLVMAVCPDVQHAVDTVELYKHHAHPRSVVEEETKVDHPVGTWEPAHPVERVETLHVADPSNQWKTTQDPTPLRPEQGYSASGRSNSADAETTQADFTPKKLTKLPPHTVFYQGETVDRDEFRSVACQGR